ncbi:30S ribosome-binding factor RbfA [Spongiibacter sp. KMU-158]|uniref:Ribosome-binding factor A n=1 Tax=Spongiibacter pelagi TaxID=2760804 RepID=A0A927C2K1_9GAMM|nr:30S ribosome-binding factor RbfA [Spongiibacter pelagi]MBD2860128.1 30S ribosome-binding factor RbfA [Spongiibacter pelagi]
MKEFSRTERIADFLKRELGSLIQLELRDPRLGMVSVTDAEVSRDLSHAKVYVTVLGKNTAEEAAESVAVLNKAAGFLRSKVARFNNARTTPSLHFYFDASVGRGQQLSKLIDDAMEADRRFHEDDQDPSQA